jgi:site-specific recombinase XerD
MAGRKVTCESALGEFEAWRLLNAAPNTVHAQVVTLKRFLSELNAQHWPVGRLTFEHCDAFVNAKNGGKLSNRAIRLSSLKQFFGLLTAKAYYVGNPAAMVQIRRRDLSHEQKERTTKIPMTEREVKHILANTEGFWRWATALSYWAGYRLSDCACLEWTSILADEIVVWTQKNDRMRVAVKFSHPAFGKGALREYLLEMMLEHNVHPQYVFPSERATILDPQRRSKLSVYYARILEKLGIEGKTFHSLRHSFARRLDANDWELERIGRALGHAPTSQNVTAGYTGKPRPR